MQEEAYLNVAMVTLLQVHHQCMGVLSDPTLSADHSSSLYRPISVCP